MNKPCFVLLGGHVLNSGCFDYLAKVGYYVVVVDWNERPALTGHRHIREDVKDTQRVLSVLRESAYEVQGVYTSMDLAVPTMNAIHRRYGLATQPASFDVVLSKERMQQQWDAAGLFHRRSCSADSLPPSELETWNQTNKLIIKPNVAASSRGITIFPCSSPLELLTAAIQRAKRASFDGKALVEEFVEGREFTVDMLGDNYGHVAVYGISVKYHSPYAVHNRVACKLHWNSNAYPDKVYERLAEVGKQCYRALGMKNAFGHLEIIMKEDGRFSPVEIGARSSGFIASHLATAAGGKDYLGDYIRVLHGETIEDRDYINGPQSAMWFGYDIPSGRSSKKISSLMPFLPEGIRNLWSDRHGLVVGRLFSDIIDDGGRDDNGFEMLSGPRDLLTYDTICRAEQAFLNDFLY